MTESMSMPQPSGQPLPVPEHDYEPSLLPVVVRFAPPAMLPYAADLARIHGRDGGAAPPWLPLEDEVATALAARWGELEPALGGNILQALPSVARRAGEEHRAGIRRLAADFYGEEARLLVEAGLARAEGDETAALELFEANASDRHSSYRAGALALLAPLLTEARTHEVVRLLREVWEVPAARMALDLAEAGALRPGDATGLLERLAGERPRDPFPAMVAACLLPHAATEEVPGHLAYLEPPGEDDWRPPDWLYAALIVRAGPWLEASKLEAWISRVASPWQAHLALVAPGGEGEEGMIRSHPAGPALARRLAALDPAERAAEAERVLEGVFDRWAGAGPPERAMLGTETQPLENFPSGDGLDVDEEDAGGPAGVVRRSEEDEVPIETAAPPSSERFVQATVVQGERRRETFVAGERNDVLCWIGPDDPDDPEKRAVAPMPIREDQIPPEGMKLTVQLVWGGQTATDEIFLPKSPSARSGTAVLPLHVPEGETMVAADVAFLYEGRVFELVRIEALVLPAGEEERDGHRLRVRMQAQRREVIDLAERPRTDAVAVQDGDGIAIFGPRGVGRYTLQQTAGAVEWLAREVFQSEKSLVRRRAAAGEDSEVLDAEAEDVRVLIRDLARHGCNLLKELRAQTFEDPGERIQILNLEPTAYVPLEFVYDRGHPVEDAKLCDGWRKILLEDAGTCPVCTPTEELTDEDRDGMETICPLGFWSFRKVIERHDEEAGRKSEAAGPRDELTDLLPVRRALFASSHRVKESDRQETAAGLAATLEETWPVEDWEGWKQAVGERQPELLLALPHHGREGGIETLEIGGASLLHQSRLSPLYVTTRTGGPGPLVILLGCETEATAETGYVSFAREFTRNRAAVVVGTLAKVLGRHAAPVARAVVEELATLETSESFGHVMRKLRKRLLGRGYLMALCLVALGDADWRLTPAETEGD